MVRLLAYFFVYVRLFSWYPFTQELSLSETGVIGSAAIPVLGTWWSGVQGQPQLHSKLMSTNPPKWTNPLWWLVFCHLATCQGHLGRGNFNWEKCPISLACGQACEMFSWLMIAVRGASLLWSVPTLEMWSWVAEESKVNKPQRTSKQCSSVVPASIPASCLALASPDDTLKPVNQINPSFSGLLLAMFLLQQ